MLREERIVYLFFSNWRKRECQHRSVVYSFINYQSVSFRFLSSCFVSDIEWIFKRLNGWLAFTAVNQLEINFRSFERNFQVHEDLTFTFKMKPRSMEDYFILIYFSLSLKSIASNGSWLKFISCWLRIIFEIFLCQYEGASLAISCFIFSYLRVGWETMRNVFSVQNKLNFILFKSNSSKIVKKQKSLIQIVLMLWKFFVV